MHVIEFYCVIDECTGANPCDANAVCQNITESFVCSCNIGFAGDGLTCAGIVRKLIFMMLLK